MLTESDLRDIRHRALELLGRAHIILRDDEKNAMDVADFGLNDFGHTGLVEVVYVNNERYCAKELVLLPRQTCPEHRHPALASSDGKQETFRCRWGSVFLYVEGTAAATPCVRSPAGSEAYYTVWHEIKLEAGGQHTIPPDTLHWFQAGPEGAVVSEFSTASRDESDEFTDPRITWAPSKTLL